MEDRSAPMHEHEHEHDLMMSVVIAAHNEEAVISDCLDALLRQQVSGQVQIVVSANGCTDGTVAQARRPDVTVIDRAEPGKSGALNAGDRVAQGYPRIYLDADIELPPHALSALSARLKVGDALAVVPGRVLDWQGCPWPVRAYSAVSERMPAFRHGLFGRGVIALSDEGRKRFAEFPDIIADDLFLDSLFAEDEKAVVAEVEVVVEAAASTGELLRRLVRVRRGNAQLRAAGRQGRVGAEIRPADRFAWLRDVVLPNPRLAPSAVVYVALTVFAAALARRQARPGREWGRTRGLREDRSR